MSSPYLTNVFYNMKMEEYRNTKTLFGKIVLLLFILLLYLFRFESYWLFLHMNRRGVLTNYWVINEEKEIEQILNSVQIAGIMTDKPSQVKDILIKREND